MSEEVRRRVLEAIADHGPIAFDEYMRLVLYGPGGFFERPPVGADAHFVTSPHVHAWVFARCVRTVALDTWSALGEPDPLRLVELGAGDGTLADALLESFGELPQPTAAYTATEVSPGARAALAARGLDVLEDLIGLDPFEGLVLANELLDNLPFRLARGGSAQTLEVRIGIEAGRLVDVEVPWRDGPGLRPGEETAVPVVAERLIQRLASRLHKGYAVFIDYGVEDGPTGGVRGYRAHRALEDVLADPGGSDVTADVDLARIAEIAARSGLRPFPPARQSAALGALGYDRWAEAMRERQETLQREGSASEAVRVWQTRSRASLLVDPAHLGSLWWLVLAAGDLPEPTWLQRATEHPPAPA